METTNAKPGKTVRAEFEEGDLEGSVKARLDRDEAGGKETPSGTIVIAQATHNEGSNPGTGGGDGEGTHLNWKSGSSPCGYVCVPKL